MKKREIILWICCALLAVALYLVVSLERWGLTVWGTINDIDFSRTGTWGQMISAIGTTIAFGVALANLISQRLIFNSSEKKRKEDEETSVYLWLKSKEIKNENDELIGRAWDLIIQNETKSPIYSWLVEFDPSSQNLDGNQKRPLLPKENIFNLHFLDNLEANKTPSAVIFFEGKSHRFWSRTIKGELKEASLNEIKMIQK